MSYYFSKTLNVPFEDAIARVTDALAAKDFGVLTTIDVRATMTNKLGVDFKPYTGSKLSSMIRSFCSVDHCRRRTAPVITLIR